MRVPAGASAIGVGALDRRPSRAKAFRGPAGDIDHLAGEEPLRRLRFEQGGDWSACRRLASRTSADPIAASGREMNAPILHFPAGCARPCWSRRSSPFRRRILRLACSIHFQLGTLVTIASMPRGSYSVQGRVQPADRHRGHLRLGKARPMQSASTTNMPRWAGISACVPLPPRSRPTSRRGIQSRRIPAASRPRAMLRLSARRSWPTSGAPMLETTATRSSSSRSSGDINCTRWPCA